MSLRGEVIIECDVKDCHAEQRYSADAVFVGHIMTDAIFRGWRVRGPDPLRFVCPQCCEEGKDVA